nr:putative dynein light chain, type 1/2 [Tanacetum cinerariifolium]
MYNVDLKNIVSSGDLTFLFAKATLDESNLWHRRLGHINFKTINKVVKGNLVRGLPSKVFENNHTCVACKKGKQHRASYPLGKFDGKADERFLVGYSVSSKAFRVFTSRTQIVQETLHINILENKPNVAGSGPTWLFDIDTFTKSMNYQPVTAGNQPNPSAGIQKHFDAKKAGEENIQQYVLFPLWSSGSKDPQNTDNDTTFEVKESEFEVEKPESEVHVSPSSSAKTKKHDEKTKREAKGKKYVVPTGRVVVPTGRVVVPTGRYVVPNGRVVVSTGRVVVYTGRVVVPTGRSHSLKTKKTHYYYTNKPVKKHTQDDDQEPQDNIKRAIVVSNKIPTKKHEQQDLKGGCENLKSKDEGKKHGYDEMTKVSHGYELKKEALLLGRDRRRSFGSSSSKSELTDFFACNGVKVVSVDMPPYMQIHVVDVTRKTYDSLEKFTAKTLALTLKKEFDGVYGPAWHCIVGSSFGSFVTHSVGGFMYFSMDQKLYVLLFKTAVQRAHS